LLKRKREIFHFAKLKHSTESESQKLKVQARKWIFQFEFLQLPNSNVTKFEKFLIHFGIDNNHSLKILFQMLKIGFENFSNKTLSVK
jgi:hypothetical protein